MRLLTARLTAGLLTLAGCGTETGSADSAGSEGANSATAEVYEFTSTTLDGGRFDGAELEGGPAVLWFWAPWCPTCRAQRGDGGTRPGGAGHRRLDRRVRRRVRPLRTAATSSPSNTVDAGRLLVGRRLPSLQLHRRPARRQVTDSVWSMAGFGASYAIASLGCTIAPFLAVVVTAFRAGSTGDGIVLFLAGDVSSGDHQHPTGHAGQNAVGPAKPADQAVAGQGRGDRGSADHQCHATGVDLALGALRFLVALAILLLVPVAPRRARRSRAGDDPAADTGGRSGGGTRWSSAPNESSGK